MANFDTPLFSKKNRHRGLYVGKEQTLTGYLRVAAGGSIALTDLIRAVPVGENVRPIRIAIQAIHLSGTPVLTNPTFNVGVAPLEAVNFKRPDGTEFPPTPADVDILSAAAVLDADKMFTDIEIPRPVLDAVSKYGPYVVTLQPAGAGAFSVAGGDIDLAVTVTYLGEAKTDGVIYSQYHNTKVKNA